MTNTPPGLMLGGIRYVTTAEAAAHFAPDVTEDMIRDWVRRGILIPAGRHGGRSNIYKILDIATAEQRTRAERRGRKRQSGDLQKIDPAVQNLPTTASAKAAQNTSLCLVESPIGEDCGSVSVPDAPFPLCEDHMKTAYLHWLDVLKARYRADPSLPFDAALEELPELPEQQSFVYYIRFGDRIKIGFSTGVKARLASVPHDGLLAIEPGPMDLEKMRHRQFMKQLVPGHREWFYCHAELESHIAMLVEHYGSAAHQLEAEAQRRETLMGPRRTTSDDGLVRFPTPHPGAPQDSIYVSVAS